MEYDHRLSCWDICCYHNDGIVLVGDLIQAAVGFTGVIYVANEHDQHMRYDIWHAPTMGYNWNYHGVYCGYHQYSGITNHQEWRIMKCNHLVNDPGF